MDSMEMRRNAIVQLINDKGTVTFAQLKEEFPDVSEMTLRTDLKCLDQEKKILRVHGGARYVQVIIGTDGFLNRKSFHNISEKKEIARKALSLLKPDTTFFLDSGSTATIFAGQIPDMSYLIYTTGLSCATELANLSKPTEMLPGLKKAYCQVLSVSEYTACAAPSCMVNSRSFNKASTRSGISSALTLGSCM